jgi:hypothetical protein
MSATFGWEWGSFEGILNSGLFEIDDAGPLSVPIRGFRSAAMMTFS